MVWGRCANRGFDTGSAGEVRDAFVFWQVLLDHRASALHIFLLLADGSDVMNDAFRHAPAREASDHPRREIVRGEAAPGRGDVPVGTNGWSRTRTPASSTHGFVVESVHGRTSARSPSF